MRTLASEDLDLISAALPVAPETPDSDSRTAHSRQRRGTEMQLLPCRIFRLVCIKLHRRKSPTSVVSLVKGFNDEFSATTDSEGLPIDVGVRARVIDGPG